MDVMTWIWLGVVVVFGVIEALTAGLVSIWFAAGALVSLLAAMIGLNMTVQIGVFLAVSALTLALTRPLIKKCQCGKTTPTNADRLLGRTAKVAETVDNDNSAGTVYIDGKIWTARSSDGAVIPEGSTVLVKRIDGVKLVVTQDSETEATA